MLSVQVQEKVNNTLSRYGDATKFLNTLNPSVQIQVATNIERAFMGESPTLTTVKYAYNSEVLETWIMAHLENLNDFCGVTKKMDYKPMEELAKMIIVEYHFLKVSELMLFFHRFKASKYGEFYGSVDPQKVMLGLIHFAKDRVQEVFRYDREREDRELNIKREQWSETSISRAEYEILKQTT